MIDIFGIRKRKIQIQKISQIVAELAGIAQQNRNYISQLQKEFEYLREFLNKNNLKIETRDEYFAAMGKEDMAKQKVKKDDELAKLQAKAEFENKGKPEEKNK